MIIPKNKHLEAATAILSNKRRASAMLAALESRGEGNYQFVAQESHYIKSALLLVHNAGATTTVLVTTPRDKHQIEPIGELIDLGMRHLHNKEALAQTIMDVDETMLANSFEYAGFKPLATLTYLERQKEITKHPSTRYSVTFRSMAEASEKELQQILQSTYIHSLDCPGIHGLRSIQNIIAGHRGLGQYDASLWNIAALNKKDVGVLLLNPIHEAGCMELAYLGCTPQTRGKGVGDALVQLAIEQAAKYGLPKITLAVDSDNCPAIDLYKRWNFRETRKQFTMIKKLC